jgi:hypothetical protein
MDHQSVPAVLCQDEAVRQRLAPMGDPSTVRSTADVSPYLHHSCLLTDRNDSTEEQTVIPAGVGRSVSDHLDERGGVGVICAQRLRHRRERAYGGKERDDNRHARETHVATFVAGPRRSNDLADEAFRPIVAGRLRPASTRRQ